MTITIAVEEDSLLGIRARDVEHFGASVRRAQTTQHVFSPKPDAVFSTAFEVRAILPGRASPGSPETGKLGSA